MMLPDENPGDDDDLPGDEEEDKKTTLPTTDEEADDSEEDDDGEEVDEPTEDEDEDDEEPVVQDDPEPAPEPEKKLSRSQQRIVELARQKREAEEAARRKDEELAELRREREQLARRNEQESQLAQQRRQYQEWYSKLTPEEKYWEDQRQLTIQTNQRVQQIEFRTLDAEDRANFKLTLAENPKWKKYEPEVEKLLKEVRATGVNATRDIILTQVLGQKLREAKMAPVERKKAQDRVKKQTTKPSKPSGDTGAGKRRETDDLESRLKGRVF